MNSRFAAPSIQFYLNYHLQFTTVGNFDFAPKNARGMNNHERKCSMYYGAIKKIESKT